MSKYEQNRNFLKTDFSQFKNIKTDKMKGIKAPSKIKEYDMNSKI